MRCLPSTVYEVVVLSQAVVALIQSPEVYVSSCCGLHVSLPHEAAHSTLSALLMYVLAMLSLHALQLQSWDSRTAVGVWTLQSVWAALAV